VKIKIDLRTKDIENKEDASNDVEDIGKLAKVLLRNAMMSNVKPKIILY